MLNSRQYSILIPTGLMKICYCLVVPEAFRKETDVQSVTDDSEDRVLCILVFLTSDFLLVSSLPCSSIDFSLSTASSAALECSPPLIQLVQEGYRARGVKLTSHLPPVLRTRMLQPHLYSLSTCLHGIMLK